MFILLLPPYHFPDTDLSGTVVDETGMPLPVNIIVQIQIMVLILILMEILLKEYRITAKVDFSLLDLRAYFTAGSMPSKLQ